MQHLHVSSFAIFRETFDILLFLRIVNQWYSWNRKDLKHSMPPFYGWSSTVSRLQSHYEETVYFLPASSQALLLHLIDFGETKSWVDLGTTRWFSIWYVIWYIISWVSYACRGVIIVSAFAILYNLPYIIIVGTRSQRENLSKEELKRSLLVLKTYLLSYLIYQSFWWLFETIWNSFFKSIY